MSLYEGMCAVYLCASWFHCSVSYHLHTLSQTEQNHQPKDFEQKQPQSTLHCLDLGVNESQFISV